MTIKRYFEMQREIERVEADERGSSDTSEGRRKYLDHCYSALERLRPKIELEME